MEKSVHQSVEHHVRKLRHEIQNKDITGSSRDLLWPVLTTSIKRAHLLELIMKDSKSKEYERNRKE
jgi:RNAse (barnase) inhibitor barstar